MATVKDLLASKGGKIFSIPSKATLVEAVEALGERNVGALLVIDGGRLAGILSERDVVRAARKGFARLEKLRVADLMTKDLIVCLPTDEVSYVMSIMTQNRIRHLPVMSGKELAGMISIGDVVKAQISEASAENRLLRDYIEGKYPG